MTKPDQPVQELTGIALRKAVAEAVGWKWLERNSYGDGLWSKMFPVPCAVTRDGGSNFSNSAISWNDAMAACEAAGTSGIMLEILGDEIRFYVRSEIVRDWDRVYRGERNPESLCRALLATLEARHERA